MFFLFILNFPSMRIWPPKHQMCHGGTGVQRSAEPPCSKMILCSILFVHSAHCAGSSAAVQRICIFVFSEFVVCVNVHSCEEEWQYWCPGLHCWLPDCVLRFHHDMSDLKKTLSHCNHFPEVNWDAIVSFLRSLVHISTGRAALPTKKFPIYSKIYSKSRSNT